MKLSDSRVEEVRKKEIQGSENRFVMFLSNYKISENTNNKKSVVASMYKICDCVYSHKVMDTDTTIHMELL